MEEIERSELKKAILAICEKRIEQNKKHDIRRNIESYEARMRANGVLIGWGSFNFSADVALELAEASGKLLVEGTVLDILDRGDHAIVILELYSDNFVGIAECYIEGASRIEELRGRFCEEGFDRRSPGQYLDEVICLNWVVLDLVELSTTAPLESQANFERVIRKDEEDRNPMLIKGSVREFGQIERDPMNEWIKKMQGDLIRESLSK